MTCLFWTREAFTTVTIILLLLRLYLYAVVAHVIINWLVSLNAINAQHPLVVNVTAFLKRIVEPVLAKIREVIPPFSGLDFSPMVLLIGITLLQHLLIRLAGPALYL